MLVAMASTKIPLYLGTYPLPLPPVPPQVGFWAVLHEIRSEYAQLFTTLFVLLVGPGRWSFDALLLRKRKAADRHASPSSLSRLEQQSIVGSRDFSRKRNQL